MPKLCCIQGRYKCYMHPSGQDGSFEDINGVKHYPRYRYYDCDCGGSHKFDIVQNMWFP